MSRYFEPCYIEIPLYNSISLLTVALVVPVVVKYKVSISILHPIIGNLKYEIEYINNWYIYITLRNTLDIQQSNMTRHWTQYDSEKAETLSTLWT